MGLLNLVHLIIIALCFVACNEIKIASIKEAKTASALSLEKSQITLSDNKVSIGTNVEVTLTTRDQYNSLFYQPSALISFSITNGAPQGTFDTIVDHGDGTYTANLSTLALGTGLTIGATINSTPLTDKVATLDILPPPGPATELLIATTPNTTKAGSSINSLTVRALDSNGNLDLGFNGTVTIAIDNNPSTGVLSGTLSKVATNGIAVFSELSIDKIGTGYTLIATSAPLTSSTSTAFNITHGNASGLVFTTSPSGGTAGVAWGTQGSVTVVDANGNTVTSGVDSTSLITLSLHSGTGSLLGTISMNAVSGVANFSGKNLRIEATGTKTLRASKANTSGSGGTPSVTIDSSNFIITPNAASFLELSGIASTVTAGQTHSLTITVKDAFSNTVTNYVGEIHFTSTDVQADLPADYTFVLGDSGVHTFSGVSLKTAGTRTITANDTTSVMVQGVTDSITVSAGAATGIAIKSGNNQSEKIETALTNPLVATVVDNFGNTKSGTTVNWDLTTSEGSLTGSTSVTNGSGDASMALNLGRFVGTNNHTVTATIDGTSTSVTFLASAESKIATSLGTSRTLPDAMALEYDFEQFRVTTTNGTSYMQWIPNADGVNGPVMIMYLPYESVEWTGLPVDLAWAAKGNGYHQDVDGPYYDPLTPSGISFWVFDPRWITGLTSSFVYLYNKVSVLAVYGRYYAGSDVTQNKNDVVNAFAFLKERQIVDRTKIGIHSASWGGVGSLYGVAEAPVDMKPAAVSLLYPVSDIHKMVDYATNYIPANTSNPTALGYYEAFFDPYLRRMNKGTEALAADPDRYQNFRHSKLSSITSPIFIAHDTWDTLVPSHNTTDLLTTLNNSANRMFLQQHTVSINHNTFDLAHYQSLQTMNEESVISWAVIFQLNRLLSPATLKHGMYNSTEFINQFVHVRNMKIAGYDTSFYTPLLLELCNGSIAMHDTLGLYGAEGKVILDALFYNYIGVPSGNAYWNVDNATICSRIETSSPFN